MFESIPSETVDQNPGQNAIARPKRTHYSEMNDKIFDIDMNALDNARNILEPISFHLFHGQCIGCSDPTYPTRVLLCCERPKSTDQ
jgi:hypothetical protein